MSLSREERGALIQQVMAIKESADTLLALLIPEDEGALPVGCTHPADAVRDESTMGEPSWRCTLCGAVQDSPFSQE
jgi:hypothetical protein